jgi:hypothetical protein
MKAAWTDATGQVHKILDKQLATGQTPIATAENFITTFSPALDVDANEFIQRGPFQDRHVEQELMYIPETGGHKFTGVYYMQTADGLPVYGSRLMVLVRNIKDYPAVSATIDLRDVKGYKAPKRLVSSEAVFSFIVLPPWYRTTWAYVLYVIGFVFVVYAIIRLSIRRVKQKNIQLEGLVKERTKEVVIQKQDAEKQRDIAEHRKELVEQAHREITDSINYAERIQRSFLATEDILDKHLEEYFVFFQPKDVVSGDFYWAEKLKNVNFSVDIRSAIKDSDLIIIHTEWNDFKSIDFKKKVKNKKFIIFDMRNIYSSTEMKKQKIKYFSIGC